MLTPKGLNDEEIQEGRNGKIESGLSQQPQDDGLQEPKQRSVGIHSDHNEQNQQDNAENGNHDIGSQPPGKVLIAFFYRVVFFSAMRVPPIKQ